MLWALASTAFFMGLMGGTHCLVMCAAPCAALTSSADAATDDVKMRRASSGQGWRAANFHLGRLIGYAATGALAALAMDRLAWLSQSTTALRPVWAMLHVLILAWGLLMMLQARQPAWLENAGRAVWGKVRALVSRPGGIFVTGMAWALLPCGLLYTALLTAALSGSVMRGALCMALFGVGSGIWLVAAPMVWRRFQVRMNQAMTAWGSRLAGGVLFAMGGIALWMDVVRGQPAPWCLP